MFSLSCSLFGKFGKVVCRRPSSSHGESWICHCLTQSLDLIFTASKRSCGKVLISQVSVLSRGRWVYPWCNLTSHYPPPPPPPSSKKNNGIWSAIGRYTSYWNAFFCNTFLLRRPMGKQMHESSARATWLKLLHCVFVLHQEHFLKKKTIRNGFCCVSSTKMCVNSIGNIL